MDAQTILNHRLYGEGLLGSTFKTPRDVVHALGAVQSQDYPAAIWALSLRLKKKDVTHEDLEHAMSEGSILRTHVMRPTWHFVAPEDIRWMMMLTGPRVKKVLGYYNRMLGLDDALFEKTSGLIEKALKGGNALTRTELDSVLKKAGITTSVQKRAHIVSWAELNALICSGPRKGKQFTYALLEERAPKAKKRSPEEALEELVRRYFSSHGPATIHDFVWWSGLTMRDAQVGIVAAKLKQEVVDGLTYWYTSSKNTPTNPPDSLFLLPNYDEFTIAYKTSRSLYYSTRPVSPIMRENVPFNHTIVQNGHIIGMWARTIHKGVISFKMSPYERMDKPTQRALAEEAESYGRFFGLPVKVDIV